MAENEELDLRSPNSARWRRLCQLIEHGAADKEIAQEAARCLYKTFQNLARYLPFAELLAAATTGRDAAHEVVRRCRKGRDYARLFELVAEKDAAQTTIAQRVAETSLESFFDQIALHVVGSSHYANFGAFNALRGRLHDSMGPHVCSFAEQIVANPSSAPAWRHGARKGKATRQREMLGMSLSPKRRKSYHFPSG